MFLLRNKDSHGDTWAFVGGKVENSESPIQGLSREIVEEIGFEPEIVKHIPIEKFTNKNKKFDIRRFKGLGEMNAGELWDTAMNPETRTLIKVTLADAKGAMAKASDMFEVLMGNDVSKRKLFIEKNAKDVRFLDV